MILSNEYIRGLIDGEGCFSFCTVPISKKVEDKVIRQKVPAFLLNMHVRDKDLVQSVRDHLGLRNRVYQYRSTPLHGHKKSYKRGDKVLLIVRDLGQLKNNIVPFFYGRLRGYKGKQFNTWLENIGNDPEVIDDYRLIFRLYKSGWFDKNPKFLD